MGAQRILEVAQKLFAIKGYEGTSLSEIAEGTGIKKPSIYAHFSSKEEIFLRVLDGEIERLLYYIDTIYDEVRDCETEKVLFQFSKRFIEFALSDGYAKIFFGSIMYVPTPCLRDKIRAKTTIVDEKIRHILLDIIEKGLERGELQTYDKEHLLYSLSAYMQGNYAMLLYTGAFSLKHMDSYWHIYWNGIGTQQSIASKTQGMG